MLLLDVETGSVASGLVRVSEQQAPKLFAENRITLPVPATLDSRKLLHATERAVEEALLHTATTAGRLRTSTHTPTLQHTSSRVRKQVAQAGEVDRAIIVLAAPWSDFTPTKTGSPWTHEPELVARLRRAVQQTFGNIPITIRPLGHVVAETTHRIFEQPGEVLFAAFTGEVLELLLAERGAVRARATVPVGVHTLIRTLQSHAGMSPAEARSVLHLARQHPTGTPATYAAPLGAAQARIVSHITDAGAEILRFSLAGQVVVLAPEPAGEWLARALAAEPSLVALFANGASVRALHTHHLKPHLAAHAPSPDLLLLLEAIYADLCIAAPTPKPR